MGALLIARREKDERHQKAVRNLRWTLGTGLGGMLAVMGFKWATSYIDRLQTAAEVRDAALVTALSEMTEKIGTMGDKTGELTTQVIAMRSLAIGSKRLPDCPPCPVCPKLPAIPPCPPSPSVIVTLPGVPEPPPGKIEFPQSRTKRER
jgi:hypothetical protein